MNIEEGFNGQRSIVLPCTIVASMMENPLYKILHVTDIGYYPHAQGHCRTRDNSLDQYIFIYCVKGEGWYELKGKKYQVESNQYFILPPNEAHSYGASTDNPWTIYWLHFTGSLANILDFNLDGPSFINVTIHSRIADRIDLFEEILHTLEMGYSKENLIYSSSVLMHFLCSIKFIGTFQNLKVKTEGNIDIVHETIHFMKENIESKLTLKEISDHVGYSISYFSHIFRTRTGYSLTVYLNQLKIQKACQLLDMTDMKVKQISYKIGVEDCYYFSRMFHRVVGMSPSEYRKLKKG